MNNNDTASREMSGSFSMLGREHNTPSNALQIPQITLPAGGGALKSIDEKFQVNAANGTAAFSIPLPSTPNRNGFQPQLSLAYNSGTGNYLFGLGWDIGLPAIQRNTDKKLPRYFDTNDIDGIHAEDLFMFTGQEELVPLMDWKNNAWQVRQATINGYTIREYRPRIENGGSRIERIFHPDNGYYWRLTTPQNIVTFFGYSPACRITNPDDATQVFKWLPECSFDDKGSVIWYEYKTEDLKNVAEELPEKNRFNGLQPFTQQHLKRIKYGNKTPYYPTAVYAVAPPANPDHFFELVFDYGEHDPLTPQRDDPGDWLARKDPFSTGRAGFELRTYRLCQRVLLFHTFAELNGGMPTLVKSLDFAYLPANTPPPGSDRLTALTYLSSVTEKGYIWRNNGYTTKALPPLTFDYQWLRWNTDVKELSPESAVHAPAGLSDNYQWVDLYNEGINGILTEQANGWYYKSNEGTDDNGNVVFEQARSVIPKPSFTGISNGTLQLQDLDASGQKQIVVHAAAIQGYFELGDDGHWQPFRAFLKTLSLDLRDPNVRMLDVNGDGKPEILFSDMGAFWFWENEGKTGYNTPELATKPYDEEKGAAILFSDTEQRIFLADMSGDGLTDLVRIRNGEVCYWANMGYGRFSAKVTMDNSPCFDTPEGFNPAYLQLTDISGTGATDLLYLGKNEFQAYLNFSGNAWSDVTTITPFLPAERPNKITVTDLTGNGTACIVWSSELPAYRGTPLRYIDLMGGKKPHIMCSHTNGMGKQTTVVYKSSTHFYLADKKKGTPWITTLPFPVQVVAQTIVTESVTNVRYTTQYTYHHGYYDHAEREFRGFGRVEQTDTEDFDVFTAAHPANEHHQPAVLTKTWYHTGAFIDRERILTQFNQEYWSVLFKNNGFTTNAVEYALPDAVLIPNPQLTGFAIDQLSAVEWREALRACKGMVLRQEIFGLDAQKRIADEKLAYNYADNDPALIVFTAAALETEQIPYSVATHHCGIELLQERGANKYAVFLVKESEAINYVYERQATDPRIAHTLTLTTDELGNVLESVSVVYPRLQQEPLLQPDPADTPATMLAKQQGREAQQKQWITFTSNSFTKDIIAPDNYYLRKNWQTQTYELTGFTPGGGQSVFSITDFKGIVDSIPEIPFEQAANNLSPQKRLTAHVKTIFYNKALTAPLPAGLMDIRSFPYQSYQLAYTPGLLQDLFVPDAFSLPFVVGDVDLQAAGFISDLANWWIPSGIIQYGESGDTLQDMQDRFFSPISYTDPLQSKSAVFHDPYYLFIQRTLDAHQNETRVLAFSYRTLTALRMLDVNDNITSVITDELGLVKAKAIEGKAGNDPLQGEEADNLTGITEYTASPESGNIATFFALAHTPAPAICDYTQLQTLARLLLNNATIRLVYDFSQSPCVAVSIKREQHAAVNPDSPLQISFEYTDGFGQIAMKKVQAEAGEVPLPDGSTLNTGEQLRWVGTGRTVLNNKGQPIRQYEPYFSTTPAYENDPAWVEKGVSPILYYDGMGRSIKTELPNGTFNRVAFDAWKKCAFDVNDTVKESAWYAARILLPDPNDPEKIAAIKTAVHYNTPSCVITDTLARTILSIDHNRWDDGSGNLVEEKYFSWALMDIAGNSLSVTDARGNTVMSWRYDMQNHRVVQTSMDAGRRWTLHNVMNNPVKVWDERSQEFSFEYDALHRPTGKRINGGDTAVYQNALYEKVVYGDALAMTAAARQAEKLLNRIGQPKNLYDSAGKIISGSFDFKGNLLNSTRIFALDYKNIPNWDIALPDSLLDTPSFTTFTAYDALNRLIRKTTPDNKITIPGFNPAGLLTTLTLTENGNDSPFIKNIDYNEKGQRSSILYGNEVGTKYKYDPLSFRLTSLVTSSNTAGKLQDLQYVYDPTGNVLRINDTALPDTFFKNTLVAAANDYTYDAQYRLINATGREADTIVSFGTTDNWNDLPFINLHASSDNTALRNYRQHYQYDVVGNIQQMAHSAGAGSWTRDYLYEAHNNRIHSTAIGSHTWLYPHHAQHGFMTGMPHLPLMQWNFKEELQATAQQVVNNGTPETTYYVYDGTGQRIRKVTEFAASSGNTPSKKEERMYLGSYEVYSNASGLVRETLHLLDDKIRIAMVDTETAPAITIGGSQQQAPVARTIRYQLNNQLESVTLELNENAQIINYEEYHPFGTTAFQANNAAINVAAKRYRYTSRERDEETGLEYHTARYYITWLGRWCSADPIGSSAGLNLYRYARNNAVTRSDVNGRADIAIHQYLTTLIASQYVSADEAINIGRASNVSDRKPELDAAKNSKAGHYEKEINIEGHALYNDTTENKVRHFYNKFKNEKSPTLEGAGENLLHPTQDAHYHKSQFVLGDRLGHVMFPEADLAVRGKSFEDFMALVHDNEKALKLMQDKLVMTSGLSEHKLSEKEWRSVYDGLKKVEDEYEDSFLLLNAGGILPILGMIGGAIGAMLGAVAGAIIGTFVSMFTNAKWKSYGIVTGSETIGEGASWGQFIGGLIFGAAGSLPGFLKAIVFNPVGAADKKQSAFMLDVLGKRGVHVKGDLVSEAKKDFCPGVPNHLLYTCK